ncbi:MAG: BON domain-containing protein [Planctomycetaceae bacterium]|nr:BON domain-containing protein [Planctomycetaceae bacterium]
MSLSTLELPEVTFAPVDSQIRERVQRALQSSGYRPLQRIRCHVDGGVVELQGRLPTFYLKQLAQSLVVKLGEVQAVNNTIEVG